MLYAAISIPLLLAAFWQWMFSHMLNNESIPRSSSAAFSWPPQTRGQWTIAFIILNFIAAGYYYCTEYNK